MKSSSDLQSLYQVFLKPKKIFRKPKAVDVVIYDEEGSESLTPYIEDYKFNVLHVRGETINVYCLFLSIFKSIFWRKGLFESYVFTYINLTKPKIVLTFIDNDTRFYKISKNCPFTKTIFIQNGARGIKNDIFSTIEKNDEYKVNYMLVAGKAIGVKYQEFIAGEVIPIGYLRNNEVENKTTSDKSKVIYVSSWHKGMEKDSSPSESSERKLITWEEFVKIEEYLLDFLDNWCSENEKTLQICAKDSNPNSGEKEYFAERLKLCKWEILDRDGSKSTYGYLSKAFIVVFIHSTVGYEALSRGKRTACFTGRVFGDDDESQKFGWPAVLPDSGTFWSNESSKEEYLRVMDYLNSVNDLDWERERNVFSQELLAFDPGNSKLKKLISEVLQENGVKL
jgi:surface carbohydrate biosynthesis protein